MVKKLLFLPFLFSLLLIPKASFAEEINLAVTDNGQGSQNQVSVEENSQAEITQSNSADIQNQTTGNADTGNNQASDNSRATEITTGNASAQDSINNSQINTNLASQPNGGTNIQANITGNGAGSGNTININVQTNSQADQNNQANIFNSASENLNTGGNNANGNSGQTDIKTGDISSEILIKNRNINQAVSEGKDCCETQSIRAIIKDNGADSSAEINISEENSFFSTSSNFANIVNEINNEFNTGNNSVLGNLGEVSISTGNISTFISIENENINSNFLFNPPCPESPNPPPPPPAVTPPPAPSGNPGGSGESIGGGQVLGASAESGAAVGGEVLGAVLPATGTSWLFLATLAAFFLLLFGWYLRLSSGQSPPALKK